MNDLTKLMLTTRIMNIICIILFMYAVYGIYLQYKYNKFIKGMTHDVYDEIKERVLYELKVPLLKKGSKTDIK